MKKLIAIKFDFVIIMIYYDVYLFHLQSIDAQFLLFVDISNLLCDMVILLWSRDFLQHPAVKSSWSAVLDYSFICTKYNCLQSNHNVHDISSITMFYEIVWFSVELQLFKHADTFSQISHFEMGSNNGINLCFDPC